MGERGETRGEFDIEVDPTVDRVELHALLMASYASMEGRIDPPSSLLAMTASDLARKAVAERLITASAGGALVGCLFCRPLAGWLYVGKMAVAPGHQRTGVGRLLIAAARKLAAEGGLHGLELERGSN